MSQYYGLVGGQIPGIGPNGLPLGAIQVPTDLKPGDSVYLFGTVPAANAGGASDALVVGEDLPAAQVALEPTPNYASIPICITPPVQGGPPPMVTFELAFYAAAGGPVINALPSAPGVFELDIQEADTDADSFYILPTNAAYKVSAVNAVTQKARVDLSPTGGKFMRVLMLTLTNDVDFTVKVTRLA